MSQQLTQPSGYNPASEMKFSKAETNTIPTKTGPAISYQRIRISTKGKKELILPTPRLFSFGVSENTDPSSGRVTGYVMPIVLYNRDGATKEEKQFVQTLEAIIDCCRDHVLKVKDSIEKYDLERSDLKKIGNALYYSLEKGKRVPDKSPVLYSKLLTNKNKDAIVSSFYDMETDETLDPMNLLRKRCHVQAAVKVESIFIGRVITIQFKCLEANVQVHDFGRKRMLTTVKKTVINVSESDSGSEHESDSGSGSLSDSPKPVSSVKKVVKRRIVRKKNS